MQALKLRHDDANIERTRRRSESGELLHCLAKGERVDVGADAADTLHERNHLDVVARFRQVLDAPEIESDMELGVRDRFAFAEHVELVRLFQRGVVGTHGNLVAHRSSWWRFTPGLSPARSRSGS